MVRIQPDVPSLIVEMKIDTPKSIVSYQTLLKIIEARRHDEKALQQHRDEVTKVSITIDALEAYAKWLQEKEIEVAKTSQSLNTTL